MSSMNYLLCLLSLEMEILFRPLLLLRFNVFFPLTDFILLLKPCLFFLLLLDGWYVLFIKLNFKIYSITGGKNRGFLPYNKV